MGHDISGYKILVAGEEATQPVEVAYIRFGAFNKYSYLIYEALDVMELNGGVSGVGDERQFTREQLETAKSKLNYMTGEDGLAKDAEAVHDDRAKPMLNILLTALTAGGVEDGTKISVEAPKEDSEDIIKSEANRVIEFIDEILKNTTADDVVTIYFG